MASTEHNEETAREPVGGRMAAAALSVLRGLGDIIVPPVCLSCQRALGSHDALCARCWRQISFIRPPLCDRLGLPLPYDTGGVNISGAALADPPAFDRARAVAHFDRVTRDLVHKFKYGDRHDTRRLFGRWLTSAGAELLADADVLVPVPLHRWRLLRRRFNQAAILAKQVSQDSGVAFDPLLLVRRRATPSQVGLSQAERKRNLAGAFAVSPFAQARLAGRKVVLVDDVITTGSTISACAQVLKRAGAARVDVLALAMVTDDSRIML